MLPKLTSLQYLILNLLSVAEHSGGELRCVLQSLGVSQSREAFCRMMVRLIDSNYVEPLPSSRCDNGQTIHFRLYRITDLGILECNAAYKFYLNLAPPQESATPIPTEQARFAAYDPQTVKDLTKRKQKWYSNRLASLLLEFAQSPSCRNQ